MKYVLLFVILASCSTFKMRSPSSIPHETWKSYLEHRFGSLENIFTTDGKFLEKQWHQSQEITFDQRPPQPNELQEIPLNCAQKELWPSHPQQTTKEYLFAMTSSYDLRTLPPEMSSCITPNTTRKYCQRAQIANVLVMSDTYVDNCGNYYRAYWMVNYRSGGGPQRSEDNMGTLLSKGRTQYEKPLSPFPGEYVTGYTYPVNSFEFLFLSRIFSDDIEKINANRLDAFRQGFKMKGKSFSPPSEK